MSPSRAVVVGGSAAGLAAADGLRDGGWTGPVTVLNAELHVPYDRPTLSKRLLSSHETVEPLALRSSEHFVSKQIDLHLGEWAVGLDIDRRLVATNNGDAVPYDALIIATGCKARRMVSASGESLPVLRNLDDLLQIRRLTATGTSVTLIGAGFIGLEVAAALRARDIPVCVLESESIPLSACVGDSVGRWLADTHRAHGVDLRTGVKVVGVNGTHGDYDITLDDGTHRQAETVLVGIGVQPADGWLRGSGVAHGPGVLCDAAGRTSVQDVWAAGDVATFEDVRSGQRRRFEHWTNAVQQGRQVGLNVARSADYASPQICSLWTEQYGRTLRIYGARERGDIDMVIEGSLDSLDSARFLIAHVDGTDVHAITSCGLDRHVRGYRRLLERGAPLGDFQSLAVGQREHL